ncbi:hypothetical protein [Scopulibacillus darangshiensis]|nr:hypothetical protein [Scopulibacillus darangshiensis]
MTQAMNSEPSPTLKEIFEMKKAEGKKEGKVEGRKEITISMLKEGLPIELISKMTKFSITEIWEMKKEV